MSSSKVHMKLPSWMWPAWTSKLVALFSEVYTLSVLPCHAGHCRRVIHAWQLACTLYIIHDFIAVIAKEALKLVRNQKEHGRLYAHVDENDPALDCSDVSPAGPGPRHINCQRPYPCQTHLSASATAWEAVTQTALCASALASTPPCGRAACRVSGHR